MYSRDTGRGNSREGGGGRGDETSDTGSPAASVPPSAPRARSLHGEGSTGAGKEAAPAGGSSGASGASAGGRSGRSGEASVTAARARRHVSRAAAHRPGPRQWAGAQGGGAGGRAERRSRRGAGPLEPLSSGRGTCVLEGRERRDLAHERQRARAAHALQAALHPGALPAPHPPRLSAPAPPRAPRAAGASGAGRRGGGGAGA